jgi:hypothetical protein
MEATFRAVEQEEQSAMARRALERVCARGDFEAARDLYRSDFVNHVNRMEFCGHTGVRESVGIYNAIFPDLRIAVPLRTRSTSCGSWAFAARRSWDSGT